MQVSSGPDPVPWVSGLLLFAGLVRPLGVNWMLVGSAATAARGVELVPGDLDVLVSSRQEVARVAAVMPSRDDDNGDLDPRTFLSSRARPTVTFDNGTWTFGRWRLGRLTVEGAHIRASTPERHQLRETIGDQVWREREQINLEGTRIPIVPLEVQVATMVALGQDDRLGAAIRLLDESKVRGELLGRALHDRGIGDPAILPVGLRELLAIR